MNPEDRNKSAPQPLSGAAQPAQYAFDRYRDGKLMAEGVRVSAWSEVEARQKARALFHPWDKRDTLQLRPAAPVAVPASPREVCEECRHVGCDRKTCGCGCHSTADRRKVNRRAPAPLPPPQEGSCQDCGCSYGVWFAPNDVWNFVMADYEGEKKRPSVICPTCFIKRADEEGVDCTGWELRPENLRGCGRDVEEPRNTQNENVQTENGVASPSAENSGEIGASRNQEQDSTESVAAALAGETWQEALDAETWLEQNGFIQYPEGIRHDGYLKESLPEIMELYAESRIAQLEQERQNEELKKEDWRKLAEQNLQTGLKALDQISELKARAEAALTRAQAENVELRASVVQFKAERDGAVNDYQEIWMADEALKKQLTQAQAERVEMARDIHKANAARITAEAALTQAQQFKKYVHDRLDAAGIAKHEEQNALNGCRIGARLDDVLTQIKKEEIK